MNRSLAHLTLAPVSTMKIPIRGKKGGVTSDEHGINIKSLMNSKEFQLAPETTGKKFKKTKKIVVNIYKNQLCLVRILRDKIMQF